MFFDCCKNCKPPVRHAGCHGECEHYKAGVEKVKEIREKKRAIQKEENDFWAVRSYRPKK